MDGVTCEVMQACILEKDIDMGVGMGIGIDIG